jgi:hypothetical protein
MSSEHTRREILYGTAAVVAASALPAVPRADAAAEIRAIVMEIRAADMLTPAEIAALRRGAKETSAYCRKAFAHLRPVAQGA